MKTVTYPPEAGKPQKAWSPRFEEQMTPDEMADTLLITAYSRLRFLAAMFRAPGFDQEFTLHEWAGEGAARILADIAHDVGEARAYHCDDNPWPGDLVHPRETEVVREGAE